MIPDKRAYLETHLNAGKIELWWVGARTREEFMARHREQLPRLRLAGSGPVATVDNPPKRRGRPRKSVGESLLMSEDFDD